MTEATSTEALLSTDKLATGVVDLIRRLVDGNGAAAADVRVCRLDRTDRNVGLVLDTGLGWTSDNEVLTGSIHPKSSLHCADYEAVAAFMKRDCNAAMIDPAVSASLAEALRRSPAEEFRNLKDGYKVRDLPTRYHYHESCTNCRGRGEHECRDFRCQFGQVTCSQCGGDGKRRCLSCAGGQVSVPTRVKNYHGEWEWQTIYQTCRECYGTTRTGYCSYPGCSNGKAPCPTCKGTQRVACSPCAATGWFTRHYWTWLTGSVERSWVFAADAPSGFKDSARALGITMVPGLQGDTLSSDVTSKAGSCRIRLECTLAHVHAEMGCKDETIVLDAVGRDARTPLMPVFLDRLLNGVYKAVTARKPSPHAVIRAVQSARLSRSILERIGRGEKATAADIVVHYHHAVSEALVEAVRKAIEKAYHALGRGSVRLTWLLAAPMLLAAAAASALYDKIGLLPVKSDYVPAIDWGLAALPVVLVWFAAGHLGRRGVRGVVGGTASRRPRQGVWPWLFAAMAFGLHGLVLQSPIDASVLALPYAPPPSSAKLAEADDAARHALLALPADARVGVASAAASIGVKLPDFHKEGLSPSTMPPLVPRPEVPGSQMRGMPAVWKMQSTRLLPGADRREPRHPSGEPIAGGLAGGSAGLPHGTHEGVA
jgi:hypothetical protein